MRTTKFLPTPNSPGWSHQPTTHVAKASSFRSGVAGWVIRRFLAGYNAWEPEEDSLRMIYPTRNAARVALAATEGV